MFAVQVARLKSDAKRKHACLKLQLQTMRTTIMKTGYTTLLHF